MQEVLQTIQGYFLEFSEDALKTYSKKRQLSQSSSGFTALLKRQSFSHFTLNTLKLPNEVSENISVIPKRLSNSESPKILKILILTREENAAVG